MKVKTFQGKALADILPQIREELGEDAVVLSQKQVVVGGVGGFFGSRLLQVVAADRMPTDDELIGMDDDLAAERAPTVASSGRLDLVDDWDPANDAELAAEFGSLGRPTTVAEQPAAAAAPAGLSAGSLPTQEQMLANLERPIDNDLLDEFRIAAQRAKGNAAGSAMPSAAAPAAPPVIETASTPTTGVGAAALDSGAGTYQPLTLPRRTATLTQPAEPEPEVEPSMYTATTRHQQPGSQARQLAERAHQAIAAATQEIEQQLGVARADDISTTTERRGTLRVRGAQQGGDSMHIGPVAEREASRYGMGDLTSVEPDRQLVQQAQQLESELYDSGVDADVARAVVSQVVSHRRPFSSHTDLRVLAREVIAERIRVEGGWPVIGRAHRMAIVGPSGAGKSSVVAKLAEGYRRMAGYEVGLISVLAAGETIGQREATGDPLLRKDYGEHRFVSSPGAMRDALERMRDCDVVLIDTPGSTYYDDETHSLVAACLMAGQVDEVQVAIPVATSSREVEAILDHFRPLAGNRVVVTKLDESRFVGPILNLGFRYDMPITFLSDGPRIPEDLRAASAQEIAQAIIPER